MATPKKPHNVAALHQRIEQVASAKGTAANRLQRRISAMVLSSAFERARNDDNSRTFAVKGGVTIELRLDLRARSSQDFDASYNVPLDELIAKVDAALVEPVGDFRIERLTEEPYVNEEHGFMSMELRIYYREKSFRKIKLELMRAEGKSIEKVDFVPAFELDSFGLDEGPVTVACMPLSYQIAQKLHACTDTNENGKPNDRSRDLIDIILARDVLPEELLKDTKAACVEVFELRARHPWPPSIRVEDAWPDQFRLEAEEIGFPMLDVVEAAERVQEIVAEIDAI